MCFISMRSAFQFSGQRVSVRWAARLISVHGAFPSFRYTARPLSQRVGSAFHFSEQWVRFHGGGGGGRGIIVLPSNKLFGRFD